MNCEHSITTTAHGNTPQPCQEKTAWRIKKGRTVKTVCRYHLYPTIRDLDGGTVTKLADEPATCRKEAT